MKTRITDLLDQNIDHWSKIGHPAIIERFVRKNGKLFESIEPWTAERMTPKECFSNALQAALRTPEEVKYVEGYVRRQDWPLLVHHAWLSKGGKVWDPTLKGVEECEFFGVEFNVPSVLIEVNRTGYYGLYDTPKTGVNTVFMIAHDPEFEAEITKAVMEGQETGSRFREFHNVYLSEGA